MPLPRSALATAIALTLLIGLGRSATAGDRVLTLATTTSTEASGLLNHLHPDFERQTGIRIKTIAKGTGAALALARGGNADVVLVHAPEREKAFVAAGYGLKRHPVMANDFVIVGPAADPAGIRGVKLAATALARIAGAASPFASRGDDSGTHIREQALWRQSKVPLVEKVRTMRRGGTRITVSAVRPNGSWYQSVGQGMGRTLSFATQKGAYTLVDRGTYYAFRLGDKPRTNLRILCEGDAALLNPYAVIAVNPERFPHRHHDAAAKYVAWLTSPATQKRIGQFRVGGKVLFQPATSGP